MCLVTFDWKENDAVEKFKKYKKQKAASWAVVELTNSCNLNCMWCYASAGYNYKQQHMEKQKAFRLVKILADAGMKQITCSGGEPTLYPYLVEFVKMVKDHGMICHMNTNSYMLSGGLISELRLAGLSQIQTNIDSVIPQKHDVIRGKSGSFDRTVKAIGNSLSAGITTVSQTVLTKMNEDEIFEILKFSRSLNVDRCRIWDMTHEGFAKNKVDISPTHYVRTLREAADFSIKNGARNVESCEPLFPLDFNNGLNFSGVGCVAAKGLLMHISYEGDIYYCATHRKCLYNLFEASRYGNIRDFHRDSVGGYVKTLNTPDKCKECKFFEKCGGGCNTRRKSAQDNFDNFCPLN